MKQDHEFASRPHHYHYCQHVRRCAGHPLVKLLAEDEDRGQGHEFRIVGDPSGLFSTDGESLTASVTFDYEQDPARQFVITVAVTDDGSPPMEVSVYSQA